MKHRWLIAATCAAALLVAACGSDGGSTDSTAAPPSATPTTAVSTSAVSTSSASTPSSAATTSATGSTATSNTSDSSAVPATPPAAGTAPDGSADPAVASRIVSLSPTATEMLFAIGAGDRVVAVDEYSNYPEAVLSKPHDLSGFTPNVEAIAAMKPDLVVIANDAGGLTAQLGALGIKVWTGPAAVTFDDVYAQIEQLGAATGHVADAAGVVANMQRDIAAAVAAAPKSAAGTSYYHELDDTYYSVTSKTFIGQIYGLFGLKNIADAGPAGNDYPQLSAEFIITQNPSLIFLADTTCCKQTVQTVAARPGWKAITAVKDGTGVIELDDGVASRWGPRVVDYIKAVSVALNALPVPAA